MRNWLLIVFAAGMAVPWIVLRFAGFHGPPPVVAVLAGLAIVGAAFLLSWAAEVAQLEVSQALAVALLSLVAILPEYAVDMYFAWQAAHDPAYTQYAVANMTGANRLLIGVGWSLIVVLFWWRTRQTTIRMDAGEGLELGIMAAATLYAFAIAFKGDLSVVDTVVLLALFALYAWATAQHPTEEPELVGPAATVGALPRGARRAATVGLFAFAAFAILAAAEPFAEGLVGSGKLLNIDEFLLVQWLAPLASETPEFIVVTLFVLHGHPNVALRAMLSSKVNQWTLLVGMLPLVYALGLGRISPLVLDARQVEEVFLTAAQSLFAVALLSSFTFSLWGAALLFGLFAIQLVLPDVRFAAGILYIVLAVGLLGLNAGRRRGLISAFREPFRRRESA
ncbi:MAG: sodium:calcium antiporter [Chloroflexota bacterium]